MPVVVGSRDCGKDNPKLIVSCLFEVFPRTLVSKGRIYEGNLRPFVTNDDSVIVCSEWNTNWCGSPRKEKKKDVVLRVFFNDDEKYYLPTPTVSLPSSPFLSYAGELHLVLCLHCVLRHSLWPQENMKFRRLQLQVVSPIITVWENQKLLLTPLDCACIKKKKKDCLLFQ